MPTSETTEPTRTNDTPTGPWASPEMMFRKRPAAPDRRSAVIASIAALLGFVAGVALVGVLDNEPSLGHPVANAKIAYLREHGEDVNLVLIGSSALWRGLDPSVLDSSLARGGVTVHSVNLGLPGAFPEEFGSFVDSIAAVLERLRGRASVTVVLDPMVFPTLGWNQAKSRRVLGLVTPREAEQGVLRSLELARGMRGRGGAFGGRAIYFAGARAYARVWWYRLSRLGVLSARISGSTAVEPAFDMGATTRGFWAIDDEMKLAGDDHLGTSDADVRIRTIRESRQQFLEDATPPELRMEDGARLTEIGPFETARITSLLNSLSPVSDRLVVLLLPRRDPDPRTEAVSAFVSQLENVDLVDVSSLDEIPELADRRLWFNYGHVTKAGATVLTQAIAERLGSLLN